MHIGNSRDNPVEEARAIFEAIRHQLSARLREVETSSTSEDDEAVIRALAQVAREEPLVDKTQILGALLTCVRRDELRHIGTQIAVLGFERFGQELVLPEGSEERAQ